MNINYQDVIAFHKKFNLPMSQKPTHLTPVHMNQRINFMKEELNEFRVAAAEQDMAKMFDALLDLVYVVMGTAVRMGLPWQDGWDDVQRANMAKIVAATGRSQLDLIKPPGWVGPDIESILTDNGYSDMPPVRLNDFLGSTGKMGED